MAADNLQSPTSAGARTEQARAIRARRAPGAGLMAGLPGMAYQCRNDPEWTMEFVSAGCRGLTGIGPEELVGEGTPTFGSLIVPADRDRVWDEVQRALAAGEDFDLEYRIRARSGEVRWVLDRGHAVLDDAGELLGLEGFIQDITARVDRSNRSIHASRLEALGELAGSVTHDFNNLLTAILAPLEGLLEDLPADDSVRPELEEIRTAARRAAGLTAKLLAFHRRERPERETVDLGALVSGMEGTLRNVVGDGVELSIRTGSRPVAVSADPGQMEQCLLNLVVNARDAVAGRGTVDVEVRPLVVGSRDPGRRLAPGRYAALTVSDSGSGIPPDLTERVFEPFFTTKADGTGLGLATVFGIVRDHQGRVEVDSAEGKGTIFAIYLPETAALPRPRPEPAAHRAQRVRPRQGSLRVLLVDDEDAVRRVLARGLRRFGYSVEEVRSASEARARLLGPGRFDLVVTDVRLGDGFGTRAVADAVTPERPPAVLVVSGTSDAEALEAKALLPSWVPSGFLAKPFTLEELEGALAELLGGELGDAGKR